MGIPDAELVVLARGGDRDAFRQLFDRHAERVESLCRQRLRSPADVDDAVQETFLSALAHLGQLRSPAGFGSWVRAIALRACLDQHRATQRVIVLDPQTHGDHPDTAPLPDEQVVAADWEPSVRSLLARLGERDHQALYMRHIDEAPVPEIASELGLTEGSARVLLTRARERLRVAAGGVGSLVPLSWRRWFRDHVPTMPPAFEVVAVAMAVGITAGLTPPIVRAERPPAVLEAADAQSAPRKVRGNPAPARTQEQRRRAALARRSGTQAEVARRRQVESTPDVGARQPVIEQVRDSVDVDRQYPDESESQELFDVTVFADEEENSVGVYGNQVTEAASEAVSDTDEIDGIDVTDAGDTS